MPKDIAELAEQTGFALKQQGLTLTTAESCTGGGVSFWITSVPGSSDWFERGFVTYSDTAKIEMLGVKQATLEHFGAVSEETAREMAEGALRNSRADIGISITGIAGPTGGSADKPVGTVWIAWSTRSQSPNTKVKHYLFTGDREKVRLQTITEALDKLLDML